VTFANAKINKDDGSEVFDSINIKIEDALTGAEVYNGPTPTTQELTVSIKYKVIIPKCILNGDGLEYTWHYWTIIGPAEIKHGTGGGQYNLAFILHVYDTSPVTMEPKYARGGAAIDRVRFNVIKSPDATLIAMQTGVADIATDLIRTGDIEKLDADGFTITAAPGFHMGHIGLNIRPDQTYKVAAGTHPEIGPIMADVNFRHALLHIYNQEEIVASIYKYIVTPVRSLVPPALGGWVNPEVQGHPYNPGDPAASTVWNPGTGENEDACSILRYGGYVWTGSEWTSPYDLDGDTVNDAIPEISLWTPTYEVAPTSAEHGARFTADANAIGVPILHSPREFSPYLEDVFGAGDFDMYMVFWGLTRFPDHLYDMLHSSQDCAVYPWRYNGPGVLDAAMDTEVEIIKFSLDHEAKIDAAYEAQRMLYDFIGSPGVAGSYLQLYSRIYFNSFAPGLKGIVNSPGYGSDNGWTFSNMRWETGSERIEDGETVVIYALGEEPERMNPTYAHTVYAWEIAGLATAESLLDINPYTLEDMAGIAYDWEIEPWATEADMDAFITTGDLTAGSWHEDWPEWSLPWIITDATGHSLGDVVTIDGIDYEIGEVPAWDIKIENATFCMDQETSIIEREMKLHNVDGINPFDAPIINPTGTNWERLWYGKTNDGDFSAWTIIDWQDDNPDGRLSRADYIKLNDGCWYHVDSVTVTLALDEAPADAEIDKYIEFVGTGQKLVYLLREDVFWQDGNLYTAEDAKFNMEFMRDNAIPRYTSSWQNILHVETVPKKTATTDEYILPSHKLVVYLDATSQFLLYDVAGLAAILPPPVWAAWDGRPQAEILGRDPSTEVGPQTDPNALWYCPTNLYGTGMFIFEFYDPVGQYAEVRNNRNYWKVTTDIHEEKVEMFHAIGDVDRDGEIGILDLSQQGLRYFTWPPNPLYLVDADVNGDGIIDIRDIALTSYFYGNLREYPNP